MKPNQSSRRRIDVAARTRSALVWITAVWLLAVCACGDGDDDAAAAPDTRGAQVDAIIAPYTGEAAPAAAVLVAQGDRVLYERAYGSADIAAGEAATLDHVFAIMSISKSFTAVATLILVDRGEIGLDDAMIDYLPELAQFGPQLTIRHLLQQTSGVPVYYEPPLLLELVSSSPHPGNEEMLDVLADHGVPSAAPGEAFQYNDANFELLAMIVERVSGMPFHEFHQRNIFDPLAMAASYSFNPVRDATAPLVTSYALRRDGTFAPHDLVGDFSHNFYGAGDVVSNVGDMLRFHRGLIGGELIDPELVDEAFVPGRLNDGTVTSFFPFEPEASYGLGFIVGDYRGHRRIGHGGSYLDYRAYYLYFPDDDLVVMFTMARANDAFFYDIVLQIADLYLDPVE